MLHVYAVHIPCWNHFLHSVLSLCVCSFFYFCSMVSIFTLRVPTVLTCYYHWIHLCSQILKEAFIYFNYIHTNTFLVYFLEQECNWFHKALQYIFILNWHKIYMKVIFIISIFIFWYSCMQKLVKSCIDLSYSVFDSINRVKSTETVKPHLPLSEKC